MKEIHSSKLLLRPKNAVGLKNALWGKLRTGALLMLCGFVLSGASLFSKPLPLAACLVAAMPMGVQPFCAAFGAILGYFLRCEASFAAEYTALTLLMLAAVAVFQGTRLPALRWFMPSMTACVCAVLGGVSILGGEVQISFLTAKTLIAAACTAGFQRSFSGNRRAGVLLTAVFIAGLSGITDMFDLAIFAACAVCAASGEIKTAAFVGLALDLTGGYGRCALPALVLPALLCDRLSERDRGLCAASFLLLPNAVFLCFGELTIQLAAASAMGVLGAMLLKRFCPEMFSVSSPEKAEDRMEAAAQVLEMLSLQLPREVGTICPSEADEIYDAAAERVCRCCPRFHHCWQQRAAQSYEALSSAAHRIIERGVAQTEDFAQEFRSQCCHFEGFVLAVNQELEGMLYRRRYRMLLRESRQVLAQQMTYLAEYLRTTQELCDRTAFMPLVGVCALGKSGKTVSGDRGAYFYGANADFFVLLCDGMGNGEEAAVDSAQTVKILQKLLKSGFAPLSALKILNGTEILRGASCYTTVDLLHIDLNSAMAKLYKWGAAPTYLRHFDTVKTLGTANTPPGVSVSDEPEQYTFCLKREEMLVLASDGADGQQVEETLAAYSGSSPGELAALLAGSASGEDDMTAVTVCLRLRNS